MNSMTLTSPDSTLAAPTSRRIFAAYLTETRYEFMRQVRNPGVAIPVLLLPVALYALFAVADLWRRNRPRTPTSAFSSSRLLDHGGDHAGFVRPGSRWPGTGHGAVAPQARAAGARGRVAGSEDRERVSCSAIISYTPIVIAGARLRESSHWTSAQVWPPLSGAMLVGTIPFCAMGLMVGTLASGSAAPGYANLIYLPGCYLSGMFFPLPKSMHWQVPIWPQFHSTSSQCTQREPPSSSSNRC